MAANRTPTKHPLEQTPNKILKGLPPSQTPRIVLRDVLDLMELLVLLGFGCGVALDVFVGISKPKPRP